MNRWFSGVGPAGDPEWFLIGTIPPCPGDGFCAAPGHFSSRALAFPDFAV
jgi:hypothetical protein